MEELVTVITENEQELDASLEDSSSDGISNGKQYGNGKEHNDISSKA